jgi:hypothetical protein
MEVSGQVYDPTASVQEKMSPLSNEWQALWSLEPVRALCKRDKFSPLTGIKPLLIGGTASSLFTTTKRRAVFRLINNL